jgi:SAM-dependent methyltransferase
MASEQLYDRSLVAVTHYTGQSGVRYFDYQSRFGDIAGKLIARKFVGYIGPSDVVLDFGCGGGFVLKALTCGQRIGIEINPVARATSESNGVTCYETLDQIEDGTIDVAISHHSLEHVPSPLCILRSLQFKLKPGAPLIVVVPIDDWRTQRKYDPTDMNHHLYTWTPLLLGHLLKEAHFDIGTLSTCLGTNGWVRGFHYLYNRVPRPFFDLLSLIWCTLRRTREIRCIVHKPANDS